MNHSAEVKSQKEHELRVVSQLFRTISENSHVFERNPSHAKLLHDYLKLFVDQANAISAAKDQECSESCADYPLAEPVEEKKLNTKQTLKSYRKTTED